MINLNEFERLLLTNWASFINPNKLISFILTKVRDSKLTTQNKPIPLQNKSLKITISHFRANCDRKFTIWVEFVIPKSTEIAVGTCELVFDPFTGDLNYIQTLGNLFHIE